MEDKVAMMEDKVYKWFNNACQNREAVILEMAREPFDHPPDILRQLTGSNSLCSMKYRQSAKSSPCMVISATVLTKGLAKTMKLNNAPSIYRFPPHINLSI